VSRRKPVPDEARVREALAQMRAEAESGTGRVSVLGLARRLGMSNATFWRNYREIATEIRQAPQTVGNPDRASQPRKEVELADQNIRLRRERDALAGQLEAALAHLRRLTTDNARLREELEAARDVSHLRTARATRKGN
jgi:transposase-like protein